MSIRPEVVLERFKAAGVDFFAGVPDSLMKNFCDLVAGIDDPARHLIGANEGACIALATGYYLTTARPGVVYLQNSGLGNAVNPLVSLADREVYGIPLVLMIGWRGEPGVADEPQHRKQGRIQAGLLEVLGIPWRILPLEEEVAGSTVDWAVRTAIHTEGPAAIVVRKGSFTAPSRKPVFEEENALAREAAIETLAGVLPSDGLVVCTTGKASRELYEVRIRRGDSHERDFLCVGSMGHASQIALGIALADPSRWITCIDGDGAALMHLGNLAMCGTVAPENFLYVILNNAAHDSVGGQPTIGGRVDFVEIAHSCGFRKAFRANSINAIQTSVEIAAEGGGPHFLEIPIRRGARPELGRPETPPSTAKRHFMQAMSAAAAG